MRTKLLLGLLLFGFFAFGQTVPAPAVQWQTSLGGTASESGSLIQSTTDGGFIIVGTTSSSNGFVTGNHGMSDIWVIKLDAFGVIVWKKAFGGSNVDSGLSIDQTTDGGFVVVGSTQSVDGQITDNSGQRDLWILKLSAIGNIEWQKTFGGTLQEQANSVEQTTDGGFIIAGYASSLNGDVTSLNGGSDAWIIKLSSSGLVQWKKALGGPSLESAHCIIQTTDGGYLFTGQNGGNGGNVTGNHGATDAWVVKLNSLGNIEWQKSMGGTGNDYLNSVKQTPDGGYIMAGSTYSNNGDVTMNNGQSDAWVIKLNQQGLVTWQNTYGGTGIDEAFGVSLTSDGGYIVCGNNGSTPNIDGVSGWTDGWAYKLNLNGTVQWSKTLGGDYPDYMRSIVPISNGGYTAAGYSSSSNGDLSVNAGQSDLWVVQFASDGLSTPTFDTKRLQLYPNPASTFVEISLPDVSFIDVISITDLSSKTILESKTGLKTVDVSGLPSGMYLVQVIAEGKNYIGKILIN